MPFHRPSNIEFIQLLVVMLSVPFSAPFAAANDIATPPNIVFIMADDLGYADVGFNGCRWFETPALDALSKDSLVFEYAYMYPTCSPSRTALFTGRQSFRTGVYTVPVLEKGTADENIFSRWTVTHDHPVYAEPLAKAGYKSIHLGKWHIVGPYPRRELAMKFPLDRKLTQPNPGDFSWVEDHKQPAIKKFYPEGRGFLKNVGGTFRGDPAFEEGGYKSEAGGYWAPFSNPFIEHRKDDRWLTDRLTDDAIAFMKRHQDGPFFVNLHFYAVHRPIRIRSEALFAKYMNKDGDPNTGQGLRKKREAMAKYATVVESMDQNVGRLVQFLDDAGIRDNTMIVFTSDNGQHPMYSTNNQLRGAKGEIYEGGIRVPTLVSHPGKVRPGRTDTPICGLDWFPTFLDVAHVTNHEGTLDGNSLAPLLQGTDDSLADRPLFWHIASQYKHGTCSVIRKNDHKLIQFLKDGRLELYNLKEDPAEQNNLAESNRELAESMRMELSQWRKANKVPLPPESTLPY
ncbi:sulfatase [Crateriforma spongiae]|uniref:sulfatase n=1 Tax=Crateriforma spongiae TaxID=2724528 RepID=UPI00144808EE|nr:sulfatase [Crateriforma spongiae]